MIFTSVKYGPFVIFVTFDLLPVGKCDSHPSECLWTNRENFDGFSVRAEYKITWEDISMSFPPIGRWYGRVMGA